MFNSHYGMAPSSLPRTGKRQWVATSRRIGLWFSRNPLNHGRSARRYSTPLRLFLYMLSRDMFITTGIVLALLLAQQRIDLSPDAPAVWNQ